MSLEIVTNNHWRNFLYSHEVPENVLKKDFDWCNDVEGEKFLKYKDNYYALSEFMWIEKNSPLCAFNWDAYTSESFLTGIVIRLSENSKQYQIGYYVR